MHPSLRLLQKPRLRAGRIDGRVDFDVTRAVASIVVNGVMFRYRTSIHHVHSGGTVRCLPGRMKDRFQRLSKVSPNGLYAGIEEWYYDIAHAGLSVPWRR